MLPSLRGAKHAKSELLLHLDEQRLPDEGIKQTDLCGGASKSALSWKREYPASATSFPDDPACITMLLLTNARQDRGELSREIQSDQQSSSQLSLRIA